MGRCRGRSHYRLRNPTMTTTAVSAGVNGRQKKTLAYQLDRLDGILDGLADALTGVVADAVRQAVGLAVREAVEVAARELLTRPELQAPPPAPVVSSPEANRSDSTAFGVIR